MQGTGPKTLAGLTHMKVQQSGRHHYY